LTKRIIQNFNQFTDILNNLLATNEYSMGRVVHDGYAAGVDMSNFTLNHPVTKKFLETDHEFDVIIVEIFMSESLLGFAHRFNAPVIGMSAFGAYKWLNDLVGTPSPPSYVPHSMLR
jgi:glucuronosyltransferase